MATTTKQGAKTKPRKPASKYAPSKENIISRHNIKQTWHIRPPQEWLALLQEIAPNNGWKMKGQTIIVGKCPYHDDSTPSFTLSFDKGMGKCYGAGCEKLVTDIVNLVAKLRNCSYVEALLFVYNRFNMDDVIASKADEYNQYNQVQEVKKAAAIAISKIVDEVLGGCPPHLEYCLPAVEYLIEVREIPKEVLSLMPVGVFAKPVHMKAHIPAHLHALYDSYFADLNNNTFFGSICFHYNDSPGSISRFKLRHKNQPLLDGLKSFKDFSSLSKGEKAKLFFKGESHFLKDPYTSDIGVFGLHRYQSMIGKNDTNAYITEGEFDVLSVMASQFNTGAVDFMIFGIGGKGATNISFLREFGIRTMWLVPDHPSKQGDDWASSVLSNKYNFASVVGQSALQFRVFQWPPELKGGDLDEAVIEQGYSRVAEYLLRNRNAYFLNSIAWITDKVDGDLVKIDQDRDNSITLIESVGKEREVELSNLASSHKASLQEAILKGFRLVHTPLDKQEYVRKYVSDRSIDITTIEAVNTSVFALDTTQGVVDRVNSHLKEYFELAYYVRKSGDSTIFAWAKKSEELVEIPTNERALLKTIALYVNQEIEQWFDGMLGDNPIYCEGIDEGDKSLYASKRKRQNGKTIIEKAFEQQMGNLQNRDNLQLYSQGVHYSDLPDELRRAGYLYFVNGHRVFRGQFKNEGEIEWTRIHNIVDKGIVFDDIGKKHEWSCVTDIADLYSAPLVDLNKTYDTIRKMLDAWKFAHHEVTAEYLAAYILSLTVMRAIGDINITMVTGGKNSGKTSLISGLLSGSGRKKAKCPHVLESVFQLDDVTLPALYQGMEGKSHLVVIDEAESDKDYSAQKDENLKEIITMAHSMPMGGKLIHRGGKVKADKIEYFLRFPLLMAAIKLPADSTFLSRTVIVDTVPSKVHKPIEHFIDENFTMQEIEETRKNTTIGLLPHIPELMVLRHKLSEVLLEEGRKIADIPSRFLDCVLTPLTVYSFLGRDATKLYQGIVQFNRSRVESMYVSDSQCALIDACLYTNYIRVTSLDNIIDTVSVKNLLLSKDYNVINNSECGVYYIENTKWIVIVWRQARYGVLSKTPYASKEEGALREVAQRSAYAMKEISAAAHRSVQFYLGLKDVKGSSGYTIIDLKYLIEDTGEVEGEKGGKEEEEAKVVPINEKKKEEEKKMGPKRKSKVTVTDKELEEELARTSEGNTADTLFGFTL